MLSYSTEGWYGFPVEDIRIILRLALEACPSDDVIYDLTELVEDGTYESSDDLIDEAEHLLALDFTVSRRIVVLTEGVTDKWILERSLKLLRPHLHDFFAFMDFDGAKVAGGSGALASIVKAFVGAGILNRVVAIFDNDTAGQAATAQLSAVVLPPNIAVMRLPPTKLLRSYPTLGPTGNAAMDVNGLAGSLELYLGRDVLTVNGELLPVQWKGYDEKLGQYQGEVVGKAGIHERFKTKLSECQNDSAKVAKMIGTGLRMLRALCNASNNRLGYNDNPATRTCGLPIESE
jgi:hypothetical protein